jgi:hypothetical protein
MRELICSLALMFLCGGAQAESSMSVRVTLYGYADNDPPGTAIAHPVLHRRAGGDGTFSNPLTFASNPMQFRPGTKIYVPYLKRYFIMEDDCAQAIASANTRAPLIDLWAGGSAGSDYNALMAAESHYTRGSAEIIVNPSPNYPVIAGNIFEDRFASSARVVSR